MRESCKRKGRIGRIDELDGGSAFDDGAMEKTLGRGHGEQRADFAASAGLAENRDVIGIAAELGDVPIHPAKSMHDVEHAYFARGSEIRAAQLRQIEEAEAFSR